ncbi:MAG: ABC transporter substrate-binding protein [Candidatus Limnocylindrales bacterium]
MEDSFVRRRRLVAGLIASVLIVGACSSGGTSTASPETSAAAPSSEASAGESAAPASGGQLGGTVSVIGTWTGTEQDSFMAMVAPWEQQTGAKVQYTGTRDINAVLSTGIQSGLLPDLAGLPGPGQMAEYYAAGALKSLDDTLDVNTYKSQTSPGLVALGTIDGKITGIFIKADIKGLFWYNKDVYKAGDPTSYDDLLAKGEQTAASIGGDAKTFCIGLESGAATGWPATDWIEGFVLHQSGPDVYDQWIAGKQKWSSPEIKQAFQSFGDAVANAFGGSKNVLATNFVASGDHLFSNPPGCVFVNHATFITDAFQKTGGAKPDQFDFFPFPDINPAFSGAVEGSGDLFGMFNDTPQAKSLIAYLATPEAQAIWVGRGGALSANSQVTNYPNDILKKAAGDLAAAKLFRFDASDNMPQAMNDAFFKAIVDYTQDPSKLDSVLSNLDDVQSSAYGG